MGYIVYKEKEGNKRSDLRLYLKVLDEVGYVLVARKEEATVFETEEIAENVTHDHIVSLFRMGKTITPGCRYNMEKYVENNNL